MDTEQMRRIGRKAMDAGFTGLGRAMRDSAFEIDRLRAQVERVQTLEPKWRKRFISWSKTTRFFGEQLAIQDCIEELRAALNGDSDTQ
jgi:hypothetical protein